MSDVEKKINEMTGETDVTDMQGVSPRHPITNMGNTPVK